MLLKPLSLAAGLLAASANAFLVPPEVTSPDVEIASSINTAALKAAEAQVIKIDCPGCPVVFSGRHGPPRVKTDKANHLELSFTIDQQPEFDRLLLNGFELYPTADPFNEVLAVPQVLDRKKARKVDKAAVEKRHGPGGPWGGPPFGKGGPFGGKASPWGNGPWGKGGPWGKNGGPNGHPHWKPQPQPLGFGLQVSPVVKDAESQMELVSIDLQIIEIGTVFVDGIPGVHIELIKDPSGHLLIGKIETGAEPTLLEVEKQDECTTLLCKWLAMVQDRIQGIKSGKPCHGAQEDSSAPSPDQAMPQEPESGNDWHKMHHHHSWGMLFKNIASHILLPVLIGIAAGVSVSLVGMVVGTLIVSLWRAFFRRPGRHHRRHHSHHKSSAVHKETAVVEEEKSGLMGHQDPPPSYEADDVKKAADVQV
ncbi:hypothetical protein B0H67DRAFT_596063 [Lasiosphaeris hirsuta]|uniref:DUF7728 domain-containing protein n=1 Tax=Lasiosphaeris hirsuta TaxID=260670 RepID=A0AA40B8Q5_9PEZI|nr:hypothetical protein B0H67DRAFT_596063 [Lasiosphaeris hirsuta]